MDLNALIAGLDQRELLRIVISLLLVALVTWLLLRLSQGIVKRTLDSVWRSREADDTAAHLSAVEEMKRRRTLEDLLGTLVRISILVIAGVVCLAILHVDAGAVLAGLGLASLGLALGIQNLVRDVVAGVFVILENQYAEGDLVRVADVTGTVERLSLRRTVLRDQDGTQHVVPNGLIGVASNRTRAWGRVMVDVPIRDPADLERARAAALKAAESLAAEAAWKPRFLEPASVSGVLAVTGSGVLIQAQAMVVASDRRAAADELRRRIVAAFSAEGIPFGDLPPGWTVER